LVVLKYFFFKNKVSQNIINTKQMSVITELDRGYPNPLIPEVAATDWIVFIHMGNPPLANAIVGNKKNNRNAKLDLI
jgi:hypothetical protein